MTAEGKNLIPAAKIVLRKQIWIANCFETYFEWKCSMNFPSFPRNYPSLASQHGKWKWKHKCSMNFPLLPSEWPLAGFSAWNWCGNGAINWAKIFSHPERKTKTKLQKTKTKLEKTKTKNGSINWAYSSSSSSSYVCIEQSIGHGAVIREGCGLPRITRDAGNM